MPAFIGRRRRIGCMSYQEEIILPFSIDERAHGEIRFENWLV